jgi:hypothetical protein
LDKPAFLAVLLAISACAPSNGDGDGAPNDNSAQVAATGEVQADVSPPSKDGPSTAVLARLPNAEGGDGAAQKGILAIREGCVVLESGEKAWLIGVTNKSIRWNGRNLTGQDGSTFSPGDVIMLGGSQASRGAALAWTGEVPERCLAYPTFVTQSVSRESSAR